MSEETQIFIPKEELGKGHRDNIVRSVEVAKTGNVYAEKVVTDEKDVREFLGEQYDEALFYSEVVDLDFRCTHLMHCLAFELVSIDGKNQLRFIFPLASGGTFQQLEKKVSKSPDYKEGLLFNPNMVTAFIQDVSTAFDFLHNKLGYAHQDIESDQILFDSEHFYVADFGRIKNRHYKKNRRDKKRQRKFASNVIFFTPRSRI